MKVAIQGVRGAFHEVAAREYFSDKDIDIVEKMTFEEVLNSVENCENDYGLIAIENTIATPSKEAILTGEISLTPSAARSPDLRVIYLKYNISLKAATEESSSA